VLRVDDVDLKILRILASNARATYTEIGRSLGMSDVAVYKRVKKLEQSGVIKKYTAIVDPAKLGYSKVSFTGINVAPEALLSVVEQLREREYVKFLAITTGDHQLIAVIWARSSDELVEIHREIEKIPGVLKVYPAIVLDVIKEYSL